MQNNNKKNILNEIDLIWSQRETLKQDPHKKKETSPLIKSAIDLIDNGTIRTAEKKDSVWVVNETAKKAILLYFIISQSELMDFGSMSFYDKVPIKFVNSKEAEFQSLNSRLVPGSIVRYGAYIGSNVVIMPSFVNIGAYIDNNSMIDSYATIGSCAQIGKNCHISSNVTIGGVLEPIVGKPVIIEDNCFIGAGSQVLEGMMVEENSIIAAGVTLSASTRIIYRDTGEVIYGIIPKNSVVVSGSYGGDNKNIPALSCAVIIKSVSEESKKKLSINEILRI